MASQNDQYQQPQTQTPREDDKRGGGPGSSSSTTTSFGGQGGHHQGEGSSQPHRNPVSMSVDGTTGSDFFTLDGMQYNITTTGEFDGKEDDHGGYNVQDLYRDSDEVFSCDNLYAVMDSSHPTVAVTEVENPSDWHSDSCLQVGPSNVNQLGPSGSGSQTGTVAAGATKDNGSDSTTCLGVGGMKIPASGGYPSNGSFYRLVTLTNNLNSAGAVGMAYSEVGPTDTSSSATESVGGTSVPPIISTGNSSLGNSQSPEAMASPAAGTKVRKPRGRKPKHVKEAEAAAAAATTAASATPTPAETANASPKGTVVQSNNLYPRYGNQDDKAALTTPIHLQAAPPSSPAASAQPQTVTAPPVPPNSPYLPLQQQVNTSTGLGSAVASKFHGRTQWSQSQPNMSLEQLASHDRRVILMAMRNQSMSVAEKPHHHHHKPHHHQCPQQQQHQASQNMQLPPPPTSETNRMYPQQHQHRPMYSEQPAPPSPYGRPTQSFAGANQPEAKNPLDQFFASRISAPSNRSTVKPNIIQENRGIYNLLTTPTTKSYSPASLEHLKLSQERWMQYPNPSILSENLNAPSSNQHAAASAPGVPHHHPNYQLPLPPTVDHAAIQDDVVNGNIHRESDFNSAASHPHSYDYASGYHRYTNQLHDINERVERLAHGIYKLKRQEQYLEKVNRHLANRLRVVMEDNIVFRDKYELSLELNEDRRHGAGERGFLPSYLDDDLLGHHGNGFGRRRCNRYDDSDGFLPVSDKLLDNLSWQLEGISQAGFSSRRHAPYYRRSSLRMREHGPLEREVRREGYYRGDEGKRRVDESSPQYGNLQKRIRPDTLEMCGVTGEGKVNKALGGDDGNNPKNFGTGISDAVSQSSSQIPEVVDISSVKLEPPSPTRTNLTDLGRLSSLKSVATELVTPTTTDDGENTSSTVFNSPSKPGNFTHSTGPYFQSYDFESFQGLRGRGDSIMAQAQINKSAGGTGNNEKVQEGECAAAV